MEKQIQSIQRFKTKIQSSNLFSGTLITIPTTIPTQGKEGRSQSSTDYCLGLINGNIL